MWVQAVCAASRAEGLGAVLPSRGQGDGGTGAGDAGDAVETADDLFEFGDGADADLDEERFLAGEEVAGLDLGEVLELPAEVVQIAAVGGDDADEGGDAEADAFGCHAGAVSENDAARFEFAHPVVDRRGRQPHLTPQFREGHPGVGSEQFHDPPVYRVHALRP
jgi:hypothetical protein